MQALNSQETPWSQVLGDVPRTDLATKVVASPWEEFFDTFSLTYTNAVLEESVKQVAQSVESQISVDERLHSLLSWFGEQSTLSQFPLTRERRWRWQLISRLQSSPTVENLFQQAQTLTLSDQHKLVWLLVKQVKTSAAREARREVTSNLVQGRQVDAGEESGRQASHSSVLNFRVREMRWLDAHRDEYAGQWVVVEGDQLISHGTSAREVYQEARRLGVAVPFLVQIQLEDQLPFGGW